MEYSGSFVPAQVTHHWLLAQARIGCRKRSNNHTVSGSGRDAELPSHLTMVDEVKEPPDCMMSPESGTAGSPWTELFGTSTNKSLPGGGASFGLVPSKGCGEFGYPLASHCNERTIATAAQIPAARIATNTSSKSKHSVDLMIAFSSCVEAHEHKQAPPTAMPQRKSSSPDVHLETDSLESTSDSYSFGELARS